MIIGVPKETYPGERRVALVPSSVPPLIKSGIIVRIEAKAGLAAGFTGDAYADVGAEVIDDREQVLRSADVLLQVRGLGANPHAGARAGVRLAPPARGACRRQPGQRLRRGR